MIGMKGLKSIKVLSILLVIFYSCSSKHQKNVAATDIIRDTEKAGEIPGHPINFDNAKILKSVYVSDRNGADMKQDPNLSSPTPGRYNYGDKLDVVEIKDGWLGVMDRMTRDYKHNGQQYTIDRWEKLYVQAEKTGSLSSIKLIPEDLNIVSSITKNNKTENFEKGKDLVITI